MYKEKYVKENSTSHDLNDLNFCNNRSNFQELSLKKKQYSQDNPSEISTLEVFETTYY